MRFLTAFLLLPLLTPAPVNAQPEDCRPGAFLTTWGRPAIQEEGLALLPLSSEELLLAAYLEDRSLLMIVDPTGASLWSREFDFLDGAERITELKLLDGAVVGCGLAPGEQPAEGFLFRFDPNGRMLQWARRVSGQRGALHVAGPAPQSDEYVLAGTEGDDLALLRLQPESGAVSEQLMRRFLQTEPEIIAQLSVHHEAIYGLGTLTLPDGNRRMAFSRFDELGNALWSRHFFGEAGAETDLAGRALLPAGEATLLLGDGKGPEGGADRRELFLSKVDAYGAAVWMQRYAFPSLPELHGLGLFPLSTGYLVTAAIPDNGFLLMQTVESGEAVTAVSLPFSTGAAGAQTAVYWQDQLYCTGAHAGPDGDADIALAAYDPSAGPENCLEWSPVQVEDRPVSLPAAAGFTLPAAAGSLLPAPHEWRGTPAAMAQEWPCEPPEYLELCDNGLDDDCDGFTDADDPDCILLPNARVQRISATCDDDRLILNFRICNEGKGDLPAHTPWVLYQPDPRLFAASVLGSGVIGRPLATDSCFEQSLAFPSDIGETFFVVLNIDPLVFPPWRELIHFPFTDIEETVYEDNLANLAFSCNQRVFVPTGFSPNNDGVNDLFLPATGFGVRRIAEFQVYNRWGEVVFEAYDCPPNDPACAWDGEHRGKIALPAVYVWRVRLTFLDGAEEVRHGEVTLVR